MSWLIYFGCRNCKTVLGEMVGGVGEFIFKSVNWSNIKYVYRGLYPCYTKFRESDF